MYACLRIPSVFEVSSWELEILITSNRSHFEGRATSPALKKVKTHKVWDVKCQFKSSDTDYLAITKKKSKTLERLFIGLFLILQTQVTWLAFLF